MKFVNIVKGLLLCAEIVSSAKIFSCTEKNTIALTFDDGPFDYTSELLDLLKKKDIKATFFVNAENYWLDLPTDKTKQEVLKNQFAAGHQIASHTWSHEIPSSNEEIKSMMTKLDDFLEEVIGVRPKYFRAPQGNCDEKCISYFEELGYKVIQWDTDTNDWNKSDGIDERVKKVKKFLKEEWDKEKDNYLVLMHDVQKHTVKEIIPWLIENAPFDKYKFVTVAECLGDKDGMYASNNTSESTGNRTTPEASNVVTEDNSQNVIPNDDGNKSNLVSSDAINSFKNVLYTIAIAFVLLYVSYNIMIHN
eukprot:jgi/Orpsp1_1/1187428/evm.model.d7180000057638.1